MKYSVNEEGVQAIISLSNALQNAVEDIAIRSSQIKSISGEYSETLGPHKTSLDHAIENIIDCISRSTDITDDISERLCEVAEGYQEIIDHDVFGGNSVDSGSAKSTKESGNLAVDSFVADMGGLKTTMSLGSGDPGTKQMGGPYNTVARKDGPGYEAHHIPSAAALKEFGIDTKNWPTIALTSEDHAKTDSYRSKQRRVSEPFFPDSPPNSAYKDEAVELMGRGGGFFELVRDEILNIREQCGDKYDEGISQYIDSVVEYVKKHGVPTRK